MRKYKAVFIPKEPDTIMQTVVIELEHTSIQMARSYVLAAISLPRMKLLTIEEM